MQIPKEIAALIESGRAEELCHGKYQAYDILPKYGARPIGNNEIVFTVRDISANDTQPRLKGIYRRFIFTGTSEQEDKLDALIERAGLSREDIALILSVLKLNPGTSGQEYQV